MDHPREVQDWLETNGARRIPSGGPLSYSLTRRPSGTGETCPRTFRSRESSWHPIIGPQLHFCEIDPRMHTYRDTFFVSLDFAIFRDLRSFEVPSSDRVKNQMTRHRLFFSRKKRRSKTVLPVPVLLHRAVIKIVRK